MIQVIMGLKGSGKTKKLIDSINEAVASAHGDVVCIEYGKKLTYDINYRVRLVDSKEYGINSLVNGIDQLLGLAGALQAHNYMNHRNFLLCMPLVWLMVILTAYGGFCNYYL